MTSDEHDSVQPVCKTRTVAVPIAEAFDLFTHGIASWLPLRTSTCVLEPRRSGRLFERRHDGVEVPWGQVLVWEPPRRVVLSWHPGRPPTTAQEVEVRFATVTGGTRLEIEHRGWEHAPEPRRLRDSQDAGWDKLLDRYVLSAS